jgi:hypothetical protein
MGAALSERRPTLRSLPDPTLDDEPGSKEDDRVTAMVMASGSSFEMFTALIALVLTVLALVGYFPIYFAAVATVAIGFALLAQGGTVAARWRKAARVAGSEQSEAMSITTEMLGGLIAVILGLLALVDVSPMTLLPAAALVLGIAVLLGAPAQPDLVDAAPSVTPVYATRSRTAVRSSGGVMVIGGLLAIVVGVLAATGIAPALPLTLIALVCVAAALAVAGGSLFALFVRRLA